ncbi:MAG: hypothetical protein JWO24_3422 [Rhodospirillales bacterium]|jgi:hypothetical protein|nr:hypothetical protein [Rhodospirillales bacterium]
MGGMNFPQTPFLLFLSIGAGCAGSTRVGPAVPLASGHQEAKNKRKGVWGKFISPSLGIPS